MSLTVTPSDENGDQVSVRVRDGLPGMPSLSNGANSSLDFSWLPPEVSESYSVSFEASDTVNTIMKSVDIEVLACECDLDGNNCHFEGGGCNDFGCWGPGGGCDEGCGEFDVNNPVLCPEPRVSRCWSQEIFKETCLSGFGVCEESLTCSP